MSSNELASGAAGLAPVIELRLSGEVFAGVSEVSWTEADGSTRVVRAPVRRRGPANWGVKVRAKRAARAAAWRSRRS